MKLSPELRKKVQDLTKAELIELIKLMKKMEKIDG